MSFAPHQDSTNVALSEAGFFPTKELRIKYATENTPNGDLWAFATAFFISLCLVSFWSFITYSLWYNGTYFASSLDAAGFAVGGLLSIFIFFFILEWFFLLFLMPGDSIQEVPSQKEAERKVNETHIGVLSFLWYCFYKLWRKINWRACTASD